MSARGYIITTFRTYAPNWKQWREKIDKKGPSYRVNFTGSAFPSRLLFPLTPTSMPLPRPPPHHGPDKIAVKPTLAVSALDFLFENLVHVLQGEVFCQ